MKKLVVIISLIIGYLFFNTANAQISLGANLGSNFYYGKPRFGVTFTGKYKINDNMFAGLNFGLASKGSADYTAPLYSIKITSFLVPISGLLEYHFGEYLVNEVTIKPYAGVDVGCYIFNSFVAINAEKIKESKINFGLAPTFGAWYALDDKLSLGTNVKYNFVVSEGTNSYFTLNIGALYNIN